MARYRCNVCGFIYDEDKEGASFDSLKECPVCHQPASAFTLYEEVANTEAPAAAEKKLDYPKEYYRRDDSCRYMEEIHQMAVSGKSVSAAMGTTMSMPDWDDILILGAQLAPCRWTNTLRSIPGRSSAPVQRSR